MRSAKKNVTIEIRLPDVAKAAFMERCRREGMTASDALRGFIDRETAPRARRGSLRIGIAATIGMAFGAVAAPAIAHSLPAVATSCVAPGR